MHFSATLILFATIATSMSYPVNVTAIPYPPSSRSLSTYKYSDIHLSTRSWLFENGQQKYVRTDEDAADKAAAEAEAAKAAAKDMADKATAEALYAEANLEAAREAWIKAEAEALAHPDDASLRQKHADAQKDAVNAYMEFKTKEGEARRKAASAGGNSTYTSAGFRRPT
ncbi:hypothetical protein BC835DRAFT_1523930 [Cytidiella melzeri]|nr:hypothetical protein BC835DRAFT_1523930 [Cytidiella melzeri]